MFNHKTSADKETDLRAFFKRRDAMDQFDSASKNSQWTAVQKFRSVIATRLDNFGFGPLARKTIKNIGFNSAAMLAGRIGAIIFTIVVARLLHPALYGIYMLALSTALIVLTFADLGINLTLFRYMSVALGKDNRIEARSYFRYLFKLKFLLALVLSISIFCLAASLANYVFHKPELIFPLKIMAGFIFLHAIFSFVETPFKAVQEFKYMTFSQIAFQVARLLFVPLFILLGYSVGGAALGLVLSVAVVLFLLSILLYKKYKYIISGSIIKIDGKRVFGFFGWVSISSISSVFFIYIDTLMIGALLPAAHVGYYQAAWAIVFAVIGLIVASDVLLPVFTQLEGEALRRAFQKSLKFTLILSIPTAIILIFFARPVITFLYGSEYLQASVAMHILASLIIIDTLAALYSTLFNAIEKPVVIAKVTILSLVINVILNYVLILNYGIVGAATATVISQTIFVGLLATYAKKKLHIPFNSTH